MRASTVGSSLWTMWPRKVGSTRPPTVSVGSERGFTNWPAIRPSFTTGRLAAYVSTADICRMIFSFSRRFGAFQS